MYFVYSVSQLIFTEVENAPDIFVARINSLAAMENFQIGRKHLYGEITGYHIYCFTVFVAFCFHVLTSKNISTANVLGAALNIYNVITNLINMVS